MKLGYANFDGTNGARWRVLRTPLTVYLSAHCGRFQWRGCSCDISRVALVTGCRTCSTMCNNSVNLDSVGVTGWVLWMDLFRWWLAMVGVDTVWARTYILLLLDWCFWVSSFAPLGLSTGLGRRRPNGRVHYPYVKFKSRARITNTSSPITQYAKLLAHIEVTSWGLSKRSAWGHSI